MARISADNTRCHYRLPALHLSDGRVGLIISPVLFTAPPSHLIAGVMLLQSTEPEKFYKRREASWSLLHAISCEMLYLKANDDIYGLGRKTDRPVRCLQFVKQVSYVEWCSNARRLNARES